MKHKTLLLFLVSVLLSFALAVGAVGCMVTGFSLDLESLADVVLVCGLACLICSFLFLWKWGGAAVLCLLALAAGYLWHRGIAWEQILALLNRISHTYNDAYGWGVLFLEETAAPADYPMAILGCIIAVFAGQTLCRGQNGWLTILLAATPLAACMVVTDTVPEEKYLFLLLAGLALLLLTAGVRRDSAVQGSRLTALAALPVLLALAGLFWAVPQEGYVNQSKEIQQKLLSMVEDLPQMVESAANNISTGLAGGEEETELDLKSLGARLRYTYPVMDVTAENSGVLYLRGQDYDTYSGTGWTATRHRAEEFLADGDPAGAVTIRTRSKKDLLYLPYYPAAGATLVGGQVRNESGLKEYTFTRTVLPENWREAAAPAAVDDGKVYLTMEVQAFGSTAERLRYLTLPGEADVRAQELLKSILPENATRVEIAEAIAEYVRSCAEYDLNTGRMPSDQEDFALWFLTEADTGYCVHFATAAVVLLRAADIPARYVTGYMVNAKAGQTVTVTAGNAHAWAEYYLPTLGTWVVLEATPAEELQEEAAASTEAATLPDETEAETTETATLPQDSVPTESQAPTVTEAPAPSAPRTPRAVSGWAKLLLLLALLALLTALQRAVRLSLRRRYQHSGNANDQALARWQEAQLLAKLLKQEPLAELENLAQKAKFSQHTLTAEELQQFDVYLRACRQQLRRRPWYRQLLYRFLWAVY